MKELLIGPEDAGSRLDRYLRRFLINAPQGFIYKMLRKKNIVRNGRRADGSEKLEAGDRITLFLSEETIGGFQSKAAEHISDRSVRVLYEDDLILAADKPGGLLVQRDRTGDDSLTDRVTGYLLRKGSITEESLRHFRPSPAGRLDRNTTGIVLFGKTLRGQQILAQAMRERKLDKEYLALVHGHIEDIPEDRAWLIKDRMLNKVTVLHAPAESAEEIRTSIRTMDRSGEWSLLALRLLTGKTHQLRARLADLGCPIAGDGKYGGADRFRKLHLHCFRVRADGGELHFDIRAGLPDGFMHSLRSLGFTYQESHE